MLAAVLLTALALASDLHDDPRAKDAAALLSEFRYDEARALYEAVLEEGEGAPEERAQLWLRVGMIHLDLRRDADARDAFRKALHEDRDAPPPAHASPGARELFEQVRDELPPAPEPPVVVVPPPTATSGPPGPAAAESGASQEPAMVVPLALVGAGGAALAAGAIAWGVGVGLFLAADAQPYQRDVVGLADASVPAQIGGMVGVGVGTGLFVTGAALAWVSSSTEPP